MNNGERKGTYMRRTVFLLAAAALALAIAPVGLANGPKNPKPPAQTKLRLLAFNDFHGHLEAGTPGTIVNPVTGTAVPAGGAEYFATHLKALGSEAENTFVVSAGDLIGASPLASGLMHDEPTIDFMNYAGLDTIGVGNHEFDEGSGELLRMQYGNRSHDGDGPYTGSSYTPVRADGCHPVDGCQDATPFGGSLFQYLAANVIDTDTHNPLLPQYQIVNAGKGAKIAFVGETLQGTPSIVTPTGVAGLEFLDEADTVNALIPRLKKKNVDLIVLLLHEGGIQNAPFSRGFMDVNKCENFTGPDLLDVVNRLDAEVDLVVSAHTHQPYICNFGGRLVTSAASFGRLITSIDLTMDGKTGEIVSAAAVNNVVTQTVPKDAGATAILAHYKAISDPIGNKVIGKISADIHSARGAVNGTNAAGEQPMGDVIADAHVRGRTPGRLRRRGCRVHECRRRPGEPALQPDQRQPAGAAGRGHLRGGLRRAAVRQHADRQDLHGPAALRRARAAVREPRRGPAARDAGLAA